MAVLALIRRSRRFGPTCRFSAAPCTSTATFSPTRQIGCTRKSRLTTTTIYAKTKQEIEAKRKVFIRKWRLKCHAVADSLEEAGDRLFTFARFPESQWKSIRTT